ncbi:T9SS type A sorting domain-containing protein [Mariniflexile sp. AS56]|uniref:galactose-binding domain-containing protein n=1 Tax=Mariniflexile sp. AS56 TaxID=3063957 RepID=UPI0026F1261E|nr:T9SS type A sorting domain-containing protein [Mariniflexile sp. AS56]MDO7172360.1 T9SS type A sorting domain-containing protein [Mariniflexile sp. AS56]
MKLIKMMKRLHVNKIKIIGIVLILGCFNFKAFSQTIYTNDMDYVLGDTKQRFITGAVTTQAQADNLLTGFKTMKVNGIRIPIFPIGENPEPAIMDYFFEQALAQGFPVFANPAQDSGARRIASGSLKSADLITTRDNPNATATVINVVSQFALDHPGLKWINPFNEDGKPGDAWSAAQMNAIYSGVKANMESYFANGQIPNVPELIGPCVWGLPASILVMEQTNIGEYITVASSHNLGFNHGRWPDFIALANANTTGGVSNPLPVWDSEVNNSNNGGLSRIDAAIANEVDGLVIYNSGNTININNGKIGDLNEVYMSKYLKPFVNLALTGTATQSSTNPSWNMEASRAIDGDIAGSFSGGNGSISLTSSETNPWWQLDLGSNTEIGSIKVFNRSDGCCKANMSNFTVTVTNTSGAEVFSETFTDFPDQAQVVETGNVTGRIVKIQLNATAALAIAEVQVFAPESQLSIADYSEGVEVRVYPNPASDSVTVAAPISIYNQYEVFNINGQKMLSHKISNDASEIVIDLGELSKGIYILKLMGAESSKIHKLIKN